MYCRNPLPLKVCCSTTTSLTLIQFFEKVLFIQVKRDPVTNIASVLEARRRQLGSEKEWYSFRIPEYEMLKDLDPIPQCAGQVHFINKAVSQGMAQVNEKRKMVIQYEDFCANPLAVYSGLVEKLGLQGGEYIGPEHFKQTRTNDIPNQNEIKKSLARFGFNKTHKLFLRQ